MNAPAMPGRSMTWREWLDEYDPVELHVGSRKKVDDINWIFRVLAHTKEIPGTAIGDEWRADNKLWSMRGKEVEREQA
jgi:hypothetical protein